jgi:MFS family permease
MTSVPLPPIAILDDAPPLGVRATRGAWLCLALLTFLNAMNFVDRQLITSLQIPLRDDATIHLTPEQNAWLAGYAFSVVYSVAGLFLGHLADRWHRPKLLALGLLVWSAMTAASGMAHSFNQMALARIFVAFGEASLTPAAVAMLGDLFPARQRAMATGLYYVGIPVGASFSYIVPNLLWTNPSIGWRGCFYTLGAVGLVVTPLLLLLRDPRRGANDPHPRTDAGQAGRSHFESLIDSFLGIFRTFGQAPSLPMVMLAGIVMNIGVGAGWLDLFWLNAERGFSKQGAPIFVGCVFLFGGTLGNFLGGWLGDRFNARRAGGRLMALVAIQLAVLPFALSYRFLPGEHRILLAVSLFFASILVTCMYGPVLATVQELTPVRARATMVAFLLIGLNIAGASLGAVVAAKLYPVFHSFTWAIFITSQAGLISIPLLLVAHRRYRTDLARIQLESGALT